LVSGAKLLVRSEAEALATFDYFKAIWKNGPGVVSDAPSWVVAEIERELPLWMGAHDREFVGVHLCAQSDLVLGILVSPSAAGGDGSLEDARYGSFIHVFATDHPDRVTLRVDEVRALFESTYGAPISDGAVRQQRNFMLLDFPYHLDLAKDLFIDKDRVEGGLDFAGPEPSSAFEETREGLVSPSAPREEPESRPLPSGSLSSLLSHHGPMVPSREPDGLPFDQGLSYAEVIAGLRERLYGRPSPVERERTVGDPPAAERSAPSPSSSVDGLRSREAPSEVDESATTAGTEPPALSSLLSQSAPVAPSPIADALPLGQPTPVMRAAFVVEDVEADAGVVDEEETEFEQRSFDAIPVPVPERVESLAPRRAWSPIYTVAGLLMAGLLVGGVVVFRLWEHAPVDASLAERAAPVAVLPDVSARVPARTLVESDGHAEADVSSEVDGPVIDAPELQPKAVSPAVEVASLVVVSEEVKPDLPSIEPAMPLVIDEVEAELPMLAAVEMKSAPEAVVRGAASGLEPVRAMDQVEVVAKPQPATVGKTSNASAELAPTLDVAGTDTLSEPSSEILEERAAAPLGETPATSSAGVESDATSIGVKRETKQRDERRKRERKRVMGQINRYR